MIILIFHSPILPLSLSLSTNYDQMCGLCGDYNGNPNNDFTKPDGSLAGSSDQFGNSWQTDEDEDETLVYPVLLSLCLIFPFDNFT